jgi:sugar phosphate isomerase/epimerase
MPGLVARRSFLGSLVAAPLVAVRASTDSAAPPRPGPRTPQIKLSCNVYSFNEPLTKGTMTLEEALDFCAELGFDAVDPTGYYFPGYPEAPPDRYVYDIKKRAFRLGLGISGTGVRNDFTSPDVAKRNADVALVKRWIDVAVKLGAPAVRVFAGPAVPAERSEAEATAWVVDHLKDCVAYAGDRGIFVVLQNHDDLLKTAAQTLAVRERVGSEWFGLLVDIGSLRAADDPYAEIARLAPFAYTWQIKEQVYRRGIAEDTDASKIVEILRDSAYRGYIPIETLGAGDPRPKVRALLDRLRRALQA